MLTLYSVGFYLFDCTVFGDTSETNKSSSPRFLCPYLSLVLLPGLAANHFQNHSSMRTFQTLLAAASIFSAMIISSCGSSKPTTLVIPHAVSTASAVPFSSLNLKRSDYTVINTVSATADVQVTYNANNVRIEDPAGSFSYEFSFNDQSGWSLNKFSGVAALGYFESEYCAPATTLPNGEEFARRVAISKIIAQVHSLNADGILEPITQSMTQGHGKTVVYSTTVSAKLIRLKND